MAGLGDRGVFRTKVQVRWIGEGARRTSSRELRRGRHCISFSLPLPSRCAMRLKDIERSQSPAPKPIGPSSMTDVWRVKAIDGVTLVVVVVLLMPRAGFRRFRVRINSAAATRGGNQEGDPRNKDDADDAEAEPAEGMWSGFAGRTLLTASCRSLRQPRGRYWMAPAALRRTACGEGFRDSR